ncbi:hypothetical protein H8L32_08320 [Undibacterium sp. CY18W]|uniref:Uncharacterized protein n=1 Tax=Undibacterium hunanense TaxID=2762292 RepID=A0ABR6ZPE1_9BURK|nr:hypothetical protein [Undibacterium hunanense]MBC3917474.1 hypothetical protein [Undibacterium hunanense]
MLNERSDTPPALQLLVNEIAQCATWADARKRVRTILPELKSQARSFDFPDSTEIIGARDPKKLDIHLHGALDIISGDGCSTFACRLQAVDRIARSVGLLADRIWLTDTISNRLVDFGRATNEKVDSLIEDASIISKLSPLINIGLVKFRSPFYAICDCCSDKLIGDISSLASTLSKKFKADYKLEAREQGGYFLHTGKCFEPPLMLTNPYATQPLRLRQLLEPLIKQELRSILYVAREASLTGGSIVSNSRLGLAGLLEQDGRLLSRRSMLLLEKEREINVPWVSELNPEQIIQLRDEAATALPAFRSQLIKIFSADASDKALDSALVSLDALRDQAVEVRAELNAKKKHSSKYWKVTYGVLGFGLSAYGVGAENVAAGVGGLLPLIQLLINHQTGFDSDLAKLTARPGYVLLKAQDILAHAH